MEFEEGTTAEIAQMLSHAFEGFHLPPPSATVAVRAASAGSEPSSSGRTALRAREVTERARRETDASTTRAIEKRHMSKAERKRLKRARAESRGGAVASRDGDGDGDAFAKTSKKKKKRKKTHLGPVGRA